MSTLNRHDAKRNAYRYRSRQDVAFGHRLDAQRANIAHWAPMAHRAHGGDDMSIDMTDIDAAIRDSGFTGSATAAIDQVLRQHRPLTVDDWGTLAERRYVQAHFKVVVGDNT